MNSVGISLGVLMIVGLLLYVYALQKKSKMIMYIGGVIFITPLFFFMGWTTFFPLVAVIALTMTIIGQKFSSRKKVNSNS